MRCKISTLKPAAESSLCQISSRSRSSDFSALCCCFSCSFLCRISLKFVFFWSSFSLSRPLTLWTWQLPGSSWPRSKDFHAFVGPWPLARSEFSTNTSFNKKLHSNKNENHQQKAQKYTKSTNQPNNVQGSSICMNAIFRLSITLLTWAPVSLGCKIGKGIKIERKMREGIEISLRLWPPFFFGGGVKQTSVCFRGKLKNLSRYHSSKNKMILDRVDSRVQLIWKLQVMGSCCN